jgi:hypothetical protein
MGDQTYSIKVSESGRARLLAVLTAVIQGDLSMLDVDNSKLDELSNIINATQPDPVPQPIDDATTPGTDDGPEDTITVDGANINVQLHGDIHIHVTEPSDGSGGPPRTPGKRPRSIVRGPATAKTAS